MSEKNLLYLRSYLRSFAKQRQAFPNQPSQASLSPMYQIESGFVFPANMSVSPFSPETQAYIHRVFPGYLFPQDSIITFSFHGTEGERLKGLSVFHPNNANWMTHINYYCPIRRFGKTGAEVHIYEIVLLVNHQRLPAKWLSEQVKEQDIATVLKQFTMAIIENTRPVQPGDQDILLEIPDIRTIASTAYQHLLPLLETLIIKVTAFSEARLAHLAPKREHPLIALFRRWMTALRFGRPSVTRYLSSLFLMVKDVNRSHSLFKNE